MNVAAGEPVVNRSAWAQLGKFCAVGASGYVVNLIVFASLVHGLGLHYGIAAVCAFSVAVANNYLWNRSWTFRHQPEGPIGLQAARFFAVSVAALSLNLVVLGALVGAGVDELTAQAGAILVVAPASFLANRAWTFGVPTVLRLPRALVEREPYLLPLVAVYILGLVRLAPFELVQDSWLTFLNGREIARNGLPSTEHLTVFAAGERWIDQQWLAHLAFYGAVAGAGLKAALLLHVALLAAAFTLALAAARRLGASARSVFWIGAASFFLAPWMWQLRSQSFAYVLFVATLWLLARDARTPSRRVFLVLPLLILWANLHGSVVLGAGLVVLRGLTSGWRRRTLALLALPPLCVLASPYGPALVGYYRHMLLGPEFARIVGEWRPPTFPQAWPFFLLALVAVWLLARSGGRVSPFEKLAVGGTIVAGMLAIRNITWFALAWLVIVPAALEAVRPLGTTLRRPGRPLRVLAWAGAVAIPVTAAVMLASPTKVYESRWPEPALAAVSEAVEADPGATIFASERYADWLLWRRPELAGKVAFDVRFELYDDDQLRALFRYHNRIGADWPAAAAGYDLIVLDRLADRELEAPLLESPGARRLYVDELVSVHYRPSSDARR
ncbi:MAG: GtrA family protein [Gaiellaceae bacterium]